MDITEKVVVAILGVGSMGQGIANALGRDSRILLRLYDPVTAKEEYSSPKIASHHSKSMTSLDGAIAAQVLESRRGPPCSCTPGIQHVAIPPHFVTGRIRCRTASNTR